MSDMEWTYGDSVCVICRVVINKDADDFAEVSRGLDALIDYSEKYNDEQLTNFLLSGPRLVLVHSSCRKSFTNKRRYEQFCEKQKLSANADDATTSNKFLRSTVTPFNWKTHCLLCGLIIDPRNSKGDIRRVETLEIRDNLLKTCDSRDDEAALNVKSRLLMCCDLVAAEAIYHKTCHTRFYSSNVHEAPGRPLETHKLQLFEKLCEILELSGDLMTVDELTNVAKELGHDSADIYTAKYMKMKLKEKYGDHIFFGQSSGRKDVICLTDMASFIINDRWYNERKTKVEDDGERIVLAAAKLLRCNIREANYNTDTYPTPHDIANSECGKNWLPQLLQLFLNSLISNEVKRISVGQCIVQAVRPRSVIPPVTFAIGVSLHHEFGCERFIRCLNRLGLCISYDEVVRFEQSAVQSDQHILPEACHGLFTQWAADNVDSNICTLDGNNTFHGMGIMSMTIPSDSVLTQGTFGYPPVQRLLRTSAAALVKNRGIPIHYYSPSDLRPLSSIALTPWIELQRPFTVPTSAALDRLHDVAWFFSDIDSPAGSWSSFMHDVCPQSCPPPAEFRLLPIIDLNPSDMNCIYSTLLYIQQEACRLKLTVACVTFDQPLWLKAVEVIRDKELSIVCRLGPFHTIMSYLGSIAHVMKGSGLSDVFECCYGPAAVTHMLSGKAVARAIRAHFLLQSALIVLLLEPLFSMKDNAQVLQSEQLENVRRLCKAALDGQLNMNSLESSDCLLAVEQFYITRCCKLADASRTAKLWLNYVRHVSLLKLFIRAERTGDWNLHLSSLSGMIPLFAATGHNNYAKSARLYLQQMLDLPTSYPTLYSSFIKDGYHVVRRSSRYWSAVSTDLAIEQVMMRDLKSRGGLTRGRGMTESVRLRWVRTLHLCASVHSSLNCLTDMQQSTDDIPHKEAGLSRRRRDFSDMSKFICWLENANPFDADNSCLRSLSTGIVASDSDKINCDDADEVGFRILKSVDEVKFTDVTFKKVDQILTLSDISSVAHNNNGKTINIDSGLLFNRLLIIMDRCGSNIEQYFSYELTPLPSALFKDGFMRKPDKSQLSDELLKDVDVLPVQKSDVMLVDGGYLLHAVKWPANCTYEDLLQIYESFVKKRYGSHVTVVFDGYDTGPNTKDHEHKRRASKLSPDVAFNPQMQVYRNQTAFLSNSNNKSKLVTALMSHLEGCGFTVDQAPDDADTLVVKTALQLALSGSTVTVVANDTDILVMLVYHYQAVMADIFVQSEVASRKSQPCRTISVAQVRRSVGDKAASTLLTVHALSGCDTTSAVYGHSKRGMWRKFLKVDLRSQVETFENSAATHKDVAQVGLQLLSLLYGEKSRCDLNHLRFTLHMNYLASATQLPRPERLPPTESAAHMHSYRVHLQVMQWKLLTTNVNVRADDWGWQLVDGQYMPVATNMDVAPPDILNVVRCKCSAETANPCNTQVCSCRKHGLQCVSACKNCIGIACCNAGTNATDLSFSDSDDDCPQDVDEAIQDEMLEYFVPWIAEEEVE